MLYVGCHLSASRGYASMVKTALDIGANTFAFFTRNPRGSKAKKGSIINVGVRRYEPDPIVINKS